MSVRGSHECVSPGTRRYSDRVSEHGPPATTEKQKPRLWLARTLEQAIVMIEEMTGEKLTPEEMEELRQVFDSVEQGSLNGMRH